jgi:SNF2 family DNA or RNA helicase
MYTLDVVNKGLVRQIINRLFISHDKSVVSLPKIHKIVKMVQLNELELNQYAYIKSISKYQPERLRQLCCHMQLSDQDTKHFGSEVLSRVELYNKLIKTRETDLQKLLQQEELSVLQQQKKHDIQTSLDFIQGALDTYTSEDCPVCMEPKKDSIISKCGHTFCSECIFGCIQENGRCPMCRTECTVKDIIGIKEDDAVQINIGSKLQEVLNYIQNEIPSNEKILIFCEWNKLLKKMVNLLNKHSILSELCDGSIYNRNKCIENFEELGGTKALALSSLNMASGLNLTVANHLIFLNVSENKVQETQAIARIHRLGQTRDITIAYFIAKGTVEEENFAEIEL